MNFFFDIEGHVNDVVVFIALVKVISVAGLGKNFCGYTIVATDHFPVSCRKFVGTTPYHISLRRIRV